MWIIGLVVLIIGLIISVALHELGHLVPAKRFNSIVPEYWVGFGPVLWKTKKGSTTYGVKAILLGGYVRIVGMFPGGPAKRKRTKANGRLTLAEQARLQSLQDLQAARRDGAMGLPFYELSTPKKLTIMLGGPLMNLFLAAFLTVVVLMGFGFQVPTTTVDTVAPEVAGAASPAVEAGIEPGDTVLRWGDNDIEDWDQLRELIQTTPAEGTEVMVQRGDATETVLVVPHIDDEGRRMVGITSRVQRESGSIVDVGQTLWMQFSGTAKAIVGLPVSLYQLGKSMITGEERDPNGVISVLGVARLAGEITSPNTFGGEQTSVGPVPGPSMAERAAMLLSLLASLNMALFVFNLIPLPPLDGGHVVGALWGGTRNMWARIRGRARPAPADTARMMPLTYGVFAALMVMTVILMVADVMRPLSLA